MSFLATLRSLVQVKEKVQASIFTYAILLLFESGVVTYRIGQLERDALRN